MPDAAGHGATSPMGFGEAVKRCLRLYADFRGRATRAEYWWFVAFAVLIDVALSIITKYLVASAEQADLRGVAGMVGSVGTLLASFCVLALLLPLLAVSVRRFHDVGLSGVWYLLAFAIFLFAAFQNPRSAIAAYAWIPMLAALGAIVVVSCLRGSRGANRYGAGPAETISAVFDGGGGPTTPP